MLYFKVVWLAIFVENSDTDLQNRFGESTGEIKFMNFKTIIRNGSHLKMLYAWSHLLGQHNQGQDAYSQSKKLGSEEKIEMQLLGNPQRDLIIRYLNKNLLSYY